MKKLSMIFIASLLMVILMMGSMVFAYDQTITIPSEGTKSVYNHIIARDPTGKILSEHPLFTMKLENTTIGINGDDFYTYIEGDIILVVDASAKSQAMLETVDLYNTPLYPRIRVNMCISDGSSNASCGYIGNPNNPDAGYYYYADDEATAAEFYDDWDGWRFAEKPDGMLELYQGRGMLFPLGVDDETGISNMARSAEYIEEFTIPVPTGGWVAGEEYSKHFHFRIEPNETSSRLALGIRLTERSIDRLTWVSDVVSSAIATYTSMASGGISSIIKLILVDNIGIWTDDSNNLTISKEHRFFISTPSEEASDLFSRDGYWLDKFEGDITSLPDGYDDIYTSGTTSASTSDGILTLSAANDWAARYLYTSKDFTSGAEGVVLEARIKIDPTTASMGRANIDIYDQALTTTHRLIIRKDKLEVCDSGGFGGWIEYAIDGTQFHVYRIETIPGDSRPGKLYIDGEYILEFKGGAMSPQEYSYVRFDASDNQTPGGPSYRKAVVHFDYVYFHDMYAFTPADPTPDNTSPTVSITAPTGGTISGNYTCTVNTSDAGGSGLCQVEYYVDGVLAGITGGSPYSWNWDTSQWSAGSHTLMAKAVDGAGNYKESSSVTVNVDAGDPPPTNYYDSGTELYSYIGCCCIPGGQGWGWIKTSDQGETVYVKLDYMNPYNRRATFQIHYDGTYSSINLYKGQYVQFGGMRFQYVDNFVYGYNYHQYAAKVHIWYTGASYAPAGELPENYSLIQNYPNPFNPKTTISYELPKSGDINITIYNSTGQLVRTLVNEHKESGYYSIEWNGDDDTGNTVPTGMYIYRMTNGENVVDTKKMLLVK